MRFPGYSAAVALCLCVGLAATLFSPRAVADSPAETRPSAVAVGVYFNEGKVYAPADEQAFTDLKEQTGRLAEVYLNFQSWTEEYNTFSTRLADNAARHGGVFMVVWESKGTKDPEREFSCAAVARGKKDEYVRRYAADVAKWGKPVMIRFAHEMNGRWYPWGVAFDSPGKRHNGNTPADYVAMWRHVHGIFKQAGATNVYWVWSPNIFYLNANNTAEQQRDDYAALYPGDNYVDWVGLDGYNDGVKSKWRSFPDLFDASYQAITKLTDKPLMIAEFGCSEKGAPAGTSKAEWITRTYLHDLPERYPRVRLVNWFDRDKSAHGETDWRFNSSPEALAAYRAAVNSPAYQGKLVLERRAGRE